MQALQGTTETANAFFSEIRIALVRATRNKDNSDKVNKAFISDPDVESIWVSPRVRILLQVYCGCSEKDLDRLSALVYQDYIKVISILVYMRWSKWSSFLEKFVFQVNRSDRHLPFKDIENHNFLGEDYGFDFSSYQCYFLPIKIGERWDDAFVYPDTYRLPVLKSDVIGWGASGIVYKEEIAPGCILGRDGFWNSKALQVARKHIETREDFNNEAEINKQLYDSKLRHEHITQYYGMVVWHRNNQTELDMFYELASSNLETLLRSSEMVPSGSTAIYITEQVWSLASALYHCHESFNFQLEEGMAIAHNDLKPENILVFDSQKHPMGLWKIADFGLAKIKPATGKAVHLLPNNGTSVSITQRSTARRGPGGFTAPEIVCEGVRIKDSDSIQCDIWSFGCILAEVLVFAVRGAPGAREFYRLRHEHQDDSFFEECPTDGMHRLKRPLFNYLSELFNIHDPSWISSLARLVFKILMVDRSHSGEGVITLPNRHRKRPPASEIRDELRQIYKLQQKESKHDIAPRDSLAEEYIRFKLTINRAFGLVPNPSESSANISNGPREQQPPPCSESVGSTASSRDPSIPGNAGTSSTPPTPGTGRRPSAPPSQSSVSTENPLAPSKKDEQSLFPDGPRRTSLPYSPNNEDPIISFSGKGAKGLAISSDAKFVAYFWARKVVVRSLILRKVVFTYDISEELLYQIQSVTWLDDNVYIVLTDRTGVEIKELRLWTLRSDPNAQMVQPRRPEDSKHLRKVLFGSGGVIVLWYSHKIILKRWTIWKGPSRIVLKDASKVRKVCVAKNGRLLFVNTRAREQVEAWYGYDISWPEVSEAEPNSCQQLYENPEVKVPSYDTSGQTGPAWLVPLQNTVAVYYSTGMTGFPGTVKNVIRTIAKDVQWAVTSAHPSNHSSTELFVYMVDRSPRISFKSMSFKSSYELWCLDVQTHNDGRVTTTEPRMIDTYPGKLSASSLALSWAKADPADEQAPRLFCLVAASKDGTIRCIEIPEKCYRINGLG